MTILFIEILKTIRRENIMDLKEYFEENRGFAVLATADSSGIVNIAVYARPHFIDENNVAFIMADRLTHHNLQSNPHAAFLFREAGGGYKGKRLHLTKVSEENNIEKVHEMRRRTKCPEDGDFDKEKKFIVYFKIDKILPLVGSGEN
jgi:hypothetical protein